jgi:hypothetical protein
LTSPPRAAAQDGSRITRPSPASPALSNTSTADGEVSPVLPPLSAPPLPERVLELLRTPPADENVVDQRYVTASWGSPYPQTHSAVTRRLSLSSEVSEDSPIHQLELQTPFLRPPPLLVDDLAESQQSLVSATVLANRARRPARGITEDWIRQHTTDDHNTESRHWFSDGSESGPSSLSGSLSGVDSAARDLTEQTPRPSTGAFLGQNGRVRRAHERLFSNDTLKQEHSPESFRSEKKAMALEAYEAVAPMDVGGGSLHTPTGSVHQASPPSQPSAKADSIIEPEPLSAAEKPLPSTPVRSNERAATPDSTPRLKKKIPWGKKTIQILLPRDDQRGKLGEAPRPLTANETSRMWSSWEELGYDIRGFDLSAVTPISSPLPSSQSRDAWPNSEDLLKERADRIFRVALPDLKAWKAYVDELNEAKLRALGVSFGDEESIPAPSISPATTMSRQASVTQYPPLPFSPPLPTSSASSNHAQFPFPSQLVPGPTSSAAQSPGIPSAVSPVSFAAKYNPRASISIPSPHAWSPQMLMQQGVARGGSPSLANINTLISPISPFQADQMQDPLNQQRQQSLQYPLLPHQSQQTINPAARLQTLPAVDEESLSKSPSKTPEAAKQPMIRHNASDSLQREIDEAEYHLEEQMRSQLDGDEDYSPHAEDKDLPKAAESGQGENSNERPHSVPFVPHADKESDDSELVLHHPQPHSRGHSLSQRYFADTADAGDTADEVNLDKAQARDAEASMNDGDMSKVHRASFSSTSNPSANSGAKTDMASLDSRRSSHASKLSISGLNVAAPEFKFNPAGVSAFQPTQFAFSSNTFQPMVFGGGMPLAKTQLPNNAGQDRKPTLTTSKINVNAPAFSPGQSDFSFSAAGPKFRPDAPAFTPLHSLSDSINSPVSGSDSVGRRASSIFGNIDLNIPNVVKPAKTSKAIPIVRPISQEPASRDDEYTDDVDGRVVDESRFKRHRGGTEDAHDIPRFAEPTPPAADISSPPADESFEAKEDTQDDDDHTAPADTSLASTLASETTDTKDSDLQSSPEQRTLTWQPFEFKNALDVQNFNEARPLGDDTFKSRETDAPAGLSATAAPFVPNALGLSTTAEPKATQKTDDGLEHREIVESQSSLVNAADDEVADKSPEKTVELREPDDSQPSALSSPSFNFGSSPGGLSSSRFAVQPRKPSGLGASRFAAASPPPSSPLEVNDNFGTLKSDDEVEKEQRPVAQPVVVEDALPEVEALSEASPTEATEEPTFEEIDAVMRHLDENPTMGVKKTIPSPEWHQPSPTRQISIAAVTNSSPLRALDSDQLRSGATEPSPSRHPKPLDASKPLLSTELDDPFVDPPESARSFDGAVHRLNAGDNATVSDWDGAFSDEEQTRLQSRANFFDGRVNEIFGNMLSARLGPLEEGLEGLQHAIAGLSRQTPSSRRDRRSMSAEVQNSDADDEDEELPVARRSMSPRKDRRIEQIRAVVMEAMSTHQATRSLQPPTAPSDSLPALAFDNAPIMKALDDLKDQFGQSMHLDFRGEDLRNIVEDAVERRMPATPKPVLDSDGESQLAELRTRVTELEQKLQQEQRKNETEMADRRLAEDKAAELERRLEMAETRVEIEIMNKSAFDQRVTDLEDKLKHQEEKTEEELGHRRSAEDRLSEVQRLLRISSEEETRLREALEDREEKLKSVEQGRGKEAMRLALLEAAQANGTQTHSDLQNRINVHEVDLRDARQEVRHWKGESDRLTDLYGRCSDDLAQALEENKKLQRLVDTLGTQMRETERVREGWRSKFSSLQNDMAQAAREIAEENARRTRKEVALSARQEVLDARLQAEARTRERLEKEIDRLETGERQGMRAVTENKRLETLLGELRTENHKLQQAALRYQAEFQEARESAAREVQRTRDSMQAEIEEANHQVNIVRDQLEEHVSRLQAHLDQVKVDNETSRARHDMLLEEIETSKKKEVEAAKQQHQNDVEDMEAKHERELSNIKEDSQRSQDNLLERLSISASKSEHLQSRIVHLEEKLEIAKEAALAAAQAAKSAPAAAAAAPVPVQGAVAAQPKAIPQHMQLPEKISPQALRESIMVLQEQLQAREHRIEELEQTVSKLDPEAPAKISKRDDEIIWLRELLAVRRSDLQDVVAALEGNDYDREAVKDAAIRLRANLQMEEQERERAMNGGSAVNLPTIAATLRQAATPRVAQAVGPLAAAWGNWRKARDPVTGQSISSVLNSPANSTPRNRRPLAASSASTSSLGGILTPPSSALRQTPPAMGASDAAQPTAFSSTGRRYTAQQFANARQASSGLSSRQVEKQPLGGSLPSFGQAAGDQGPVTPPMMRPSAYDADAHAQEFDDAGLFDDE